MLPSSFAVFSCATIESISSVLYLVLTRVFGVVIADAPGVEGVLLLVEAVGPFFVGAIVFLCQVGRSCIKGVFCYLGIFYEHLRTSTNFYVQAKR